MVISSSSNRSPSPMSTRPNPNPNSRTHQEKDGVPIVPARKSFNGGNPLGKPSIISQPRSFLPNTPVNSPAEFARRSSFSKDHEQKENERDSNTKPVARVRSPSPSVLKGKNFMSPTISAASKINASPRKKVLGERNEAIRTSASLSDGKFHFFSTSSMEFTDDNEPKADMMGNENNVLGFSPGEKKVDSEPDLVVLSPDLPLNITKSSESIPGSEMAKVVDIKKSSYTSPSIMASLDSDPSLPPYDPKTNYLSPRPQFLHYKPNPRIESYINQGLRLEDEFASESTCETEYSGETLSADSQKEQEDTTSSSCSSSSVNASSVSDNPPCYESSSLETEHLQETVEAHVEQGPRFSVKWKVVAFLMAVLLGFISFSVTYSPSFGDAMYQNEIISRIYNNPRVVGDLAKANLNGLVHTAKLWSAHSVSHLSKMIYSSREVKFSPLPYSNLSGWQEEEDGDFMLEEFELNTFFERIESVPEITPDESAGNFAEMQSYPEPEEQEPVAEETESIELEDSEPEKVEEYSTFLPVTDHVSHHTSEHNNNHLMNETEEDSGALIIEEALTGEPEKQEADHTADNSNDAENIAEVTSAHLMEEEVADEPKNQEADHTEEENDISSGVQDACQIDVKAENEWSLSSSQGPEVHPQVLSASEPLAEDEHKPLSLIESDDTEVVISESERLIPEVTTAGVSQHHGASLRSLPSGTAAVSLVVVSLLAATVFMYRQPKKGNSVTSAPLADQLVAKEKSLLSERVPSSSGPVEVDMIGESCPSEMSSFQNTSLYSKSGPRGEADEAQSIEKRSKRSYRRESLASSSSEYSMGPSYGSFTTYSIIPSKRGDDEVVTPVRRSNRIRKQVTSP